MDITWLGHACFRLRGKTVSLVTDPFDPKMVGWSYPKVSADIVTVSHEHNDHNFLERVASVKVLRGPGEYEVKGINIKGVATWHDTSKGEQRGSNTVFVIELDSVRVAHLGDLGHKLTEEQLGEIGDVDILLIPVGGFYTIGAETAGEVVTQVAPKVIVPMHYQILGLNPGIFEKLSGVDEFVKAVGLVPKHMSSYQVKVETLPEETELVVLERKT